MAGEPIKIDLTPEELAEADEVGRARREHGKKTKLTPGGGLNTTEDVELDIDIQGARGEKATHRLFPGLVWHKAVGRTDLCDIGDFIDVKTPLQKYDEKRRSLIHHPDAIKTHWAYVLTLPDRPPRFWAIGWAWGHELLAAPLVELVPGRQCHLLQPFVPPLRGMEDLISLVRGDAWA